MLRSFTKLKFKYVCVSFSRLQGDEGRPINLTRLLPVHLQKKKAKFPQNESIALHLFPCALAVADMKGATISNACGKPEYT